MLRYCTPRRKAEIEKPGLCMTSSPNDRKGSFRNQLQADPLDHRILEVCSLTTFPVLTFRFEDIVGQQI